MVERALSSSRIINDLEAELKSTQKREEALASLLQSGKISQETFDFLEKRNTNLTSALAALKEILERESSFSSNRSEEIRILESLLIDFKISQLLGEIGEEDWRQKSEIINLGLDSLKGKATLTVEADLKPAPPIQLPEEERITEKTNGLSDAESSPMLSAKPSEAKKKPPIKKTVRNRQLKDKRKKHAVKEPPALRASSPSEVHCMNPWKQGCRNTFIELSIYYEGRLTPICRECWEEISKKNIEWSGL